MKILSSSKSTIIGETCEIDIPSLLELMKPLEDRMISSDLVLLFASNNLISVGTYLLAERNKTPIIIINDEVTVSAKNDIILKYRPSLIVSSNVNDLILALKDRLIFREINEELFLWETEFKLKTNPDLMLMLSTSGSSGSPKLVRLSRKNIYSNANSILGYLPIERDDTCLLNLPISYSYGLSILNTHLLADAAIFLTNETFLSKNLWENVEKHRVNSLAGVPEMIKMLKLIKLEKRDNILRNLKYITQAGGKLNYDLRMVFWQMFNSNSIEFYIMYGQTEATARMSYLSPRCMPEKIGSVGVPISGGKFEILKDSDSPKDNEEGEIIYRGSNVMLGYADNYKELQLGDEMNGVLYTGDLGYIDADGFLYITGRKKRIIKINGNRLSLDHLEDILLSSGVQAACVESDDRILVFLQSPEQEVTVTSLLREMGIAKTQFKSKVIGRFPLNKNGKMDYSRLKSSFND